MSAIALAVAIVLASAGQPPATTVQGRASYYGAPTGAAAAGPGLRRALGAGWRDTAVRVSAGAAAVTVRLTDWCQCLKGKRTERLIDLSSGDFARLAPLSAGLVRVSITPVGLPATDCVS